MARTPTSRTVRFLCAAAAAIATVTIIAAPVAGRAGGPADEAVRHAPLDGVTDRFIIKLRDPAVDAPSRLPAIAGRSGRAFTYVREMSGGAHVVRLTGGAAASAALTGRAAADANRLVAQQLMANPEIAFAEPDRKLYAMATPNDTLYQQQWNYFEPAGGIDLPAAWDITTGSNAIVVAVIDTGIRPHVDLAGRTVPGYDFIGDTTVSVDGDGRDADPSDPGDGGCGTSSTWHGTHVSGTVGAASNNGAGVTGVNWVSKILPARVLGKCGGYISDIADAMRWSAGLPVAGVPANANPARVENLSLGGTETCSNTMQSAINDVVARGTVIVVAAGNENADSSTSEPANCSGVISVAATNRQGGRAGFSNYGSLVTLSAPGTSILSTLNTGTTTPGSDTYGSYSGTSMSTPHVAGVVSLMLSQNPSLTPAQVTARLIATARRFPTGTGGDCTTALCGAGIVDAAAALALPAAPARVNLAAKANGATATASSTYPGFSPPSVAIDGDRRGSDWWNDATSNAYPDWIRVDFPSVQPITEIDVYTVPDNVGNGGDPTDATTFSQYGVTAFDVQYWNGSTWVTVPNGSVTGNNRVVNRFTFAPIPTTSIRVQVNGALFGYSRIVEIEAYKDAPPINAARPANGGVATASNTYPGFSPPSVAIDGDRLGRDWWNDATGNAFPDQLQVNFDATKSINEIDVYTVQDDFANPRTPTETMTFSRNGVTDFDVQYWNGSTWVTVPGGTVNGNDKVWRRFTFPPVSTNAVRVNVRGALAGYSRIVELEAYVAQ